MLLVAQTVLGAFGVVDSPGSWAHAMTELVGMCLVTTTMNCIQSFVQREQEQFHWQILCWQTSHCVCM